MNYARRSPLTAALVAVVGVVGLGACTSNPSAKAVAEDVIESLEGLTAEQRTCMLERLDRYDEDVLKEIGEANTTIDFTAPDPVETQGSPEYQEFVADLSGCMGDG